METKHTPGPWEVDSGMVQTCDETPIAHMDRTIGNGTMPVERDANARLIAAAPDLLLVLETIEASTDGLVNPLAREINRSARKAIAKAEGRQ